MSIFGKKQECKFNQQALINEVGQLSEKVEILAEEADSLGKEVSILTEQADNAEDAINAIESRLAKLENINGVMYTTTESYKTPSEAKRKAKKAKRKAVDLMLAKLEEYRETYGNPEGYTAYAVVENGEATIKEATNLEQAIQVLKDVKEGKFKLIA